MDLTKRERNELRYLKRHGGWFWGGPEKRGKPPLHETDATVSKYIRLGLLRHVPGHGYETTDWCNKAI